MSKKKSENSKGPQVPVKTETIEMPFWYHMVTYYPHSSIFGVEIWYANTVPNKQSRGSKTNKIEKEFKTYKEAMDWIVSVMEGEDGTT